MARADGVAATIYECPDCPSTQPEPGACGRCPGVVSDDLYQAFVAGIQLVTLGSRGAADEQWVRDSFEEWRNG